MMLGDIEMYNIKIWFLKHNQLKNTVLENYYYRIHVV